MIEVQSRIYFEALRAFLLLFLMASATVFSRFRALPGVGAERFLVRAARRPALAAAMVGALPVVIRLAILPLYPAPEPRVHDEFAQLLLGETFASGRITNPPHPFAASFEAVYILVRPTYTAQYQPALGAVLAAGKVVFGHPWAGIVAATALLGAALYWMLLEWVPSRWALLGASLAMLQTGVLGYWMNSYWGGTAPALGGTLVLGAVPRFRRRGRVVAAVAAGLGLAVVMNSRPVEALLLALVVCGALAWGTFRTAAISLRGAVQIALPIGLIVAGTLCGMGYYNRRVTGSAVVFPYMLHQRLYGTPQPFWWQKAVSVRHFPNREIEGDYLRQRMLHGRRSSPVALLRATASRIDMIFLFFLGVPLAVPLLFARSAVRDKQMKFALAAGAPFVLDHLTFHAFYEHYAAPECALLFLAVVQCWRHMRRWKWRGLEAGLILSRALPVIAVLGILIPAAGKAAEPVLPRGAGLVRKVVDEMGSVPSERTAVERELRSMPGPHLVFIRYEYPGHHPDNEWVRNGADIDGADIVWARELDGRTNRALIRYYGNRRVWLLDPDKHPLTLQTYPGTARYLRAGLGPRDGSPK